jgi:excinuclease ABC subunit B
MKKAIDETNRRRARQVAHNEAMGITPKALNKRIKDLIDGVYSEKAGKEADRLAAESAQRASVDEMSERDVAREIKRLEKLMLEHARNLEFEKAASVRDQLHRLKAQVFGAPGLDNVA